MKFKVEIRCYKTVDVEADDYREAEWIVKRAFATSQSKHAPTAWVLEEVTAIDCDDEIDDELEDGSDDSIRG